MGRKWRDNLLFSGLYWDDQRPSLFFRKDIRSAKEHSIGVESGKKLYIALTGAKYCLGYYDLAIKSKIACPQTANLTGINESQCSRCRKQGAAFFAASGIRSGLTESEQYLISQPHLLYLNLFGNSLVKVGVTAEYRKLNRVLEQGASASLFIARGNGSEIREMERKISKTFSITERVGLLDKLKRIRQEINPEDAKSKLSDVLENICKGINKRFRSYFLDEPEFFFNRRKYNIQQNELLRPINIIESMHSDAVIAGRIVGILGSCLLLIGNGGNLFALDSKILQGHIVNFQVVVSSYAEVKGVVCKKLYLESSDQLNLF